MAYGKFLSIILVLCGVAAFAGCGSTVDNGEQSIDLSSPAPIEIIEPTPTPGPVIPNLQSELLDDRNKTTASPIGAVDFKNYTYELPRGWENPDGKEITLTNGRVAPLALNEDVSEMSDEDKADLKARRRIGLSYVTIKYLDMTGDGQDEAVVVLKIETAGSAIPQVAYVFTWKDGKPDLIWPFRTGDRADGGLKDVRVDNGEVVVELYGQDRFLLGQTETGKITGDEEQLCCPTHFTRSRYKWNGTAFILAGKRLTYSVADPTALPLENLGDIVNNPSKSKK